MAIVLTGPRTCNFRSYFVNRFSDLVYTSTYREHDGGISVQFTIETELEDDGRWIAEVVELSGVLKYGATRELAIAQAEALALRVIAERIEAGEHPVEPIQISFSAA